MNFFDYLFYRMKWWNTKVVLDFSPFLSAIIIMSVFQGFNVLFALDFIKYYCGFTVIFIDKYYLLLPILFFIWNIFYYRSPVKQASIEKRVLSLSQHSRKNYNILVVLYLVLSLSLLIWIGYLIRQHNLKI
jgi:hypothetical protein